MVYRDFSRDYFGFSSRDQGRNTNVGFSDDQVPEWWPSALQRICELLDLPDNWDSYGASKIDRNKAFYAVEVLQQISRPDIPKPSIVPTVSGNVQFEWHTNDIDLEIEVKSQVLVSVFFVDLRSGEENEYELDYDLDPISRIVKEIIHRIRAEKLAA